jgi:chemotaxis protein MotB
MVMSGGGGDLPEEEHEEHVNHEAWVIPYADLLTLLMAMFIALFAMSTVDAEKFKAFARGASDAFGGGKLDTGVFASHDGESVVEGGEGSGLSPRAGHSVGPDRSADADRVIDKLVQQHADLEAARSTERESLEDVREKIEARAKELGVDDRLRLRLEDRGLVVTVVTDQVLFDAGSAVIRPEGGALLQVVGGALAGVDNPILVEGHTDSTPISSAQYPSNWELSSGRAGSVARFFESLGLDRNRLRPEGLADLFPTGTNDTAEGRAQNRRVEIVVQSKLVDRALADAGLTKQPAAKRAPPISDPVADPVEEDLKPIH